MADTIPYASLDISEDNDAEPQQLSSLLDDLDNETGGYSDAVNVTVKFSADAGSRLGKDYYNAKERAYFYTVKVDRRSLHRLLKEGESLSEIFARFGAVGSVDTTERYLYNWVELDPLEVILSEGVT